MGRCVAEFLPNVIVVGALALYEVHDVVDCLGVLLLLNLADTVRLQHALPFFRKTL